MRYIDLDELKTIQCEILYKVHTFCVDNGINYSLAYGTLLGAIRHKGYIPWDDDIDIMMLRPDYEKFISSFSGVYPELSICAPELNWDYYAPYANVWDNRTKLKERVDVEYRSDFHRGMDIGVKIDVFPIDAVPNNGKFMLHIKYKVLKVLRNFYTRPLNVKYTSKNLIHSLLKSFLYGCASVIGYRNIQKLTVKLGKSYNLHKAQRVAMIVFDYEGQDFPKSSFDKYIDVFFENYRFKSIANYDEYLYASYGDYMKLPPIEQRVPHHYFSAYWKD